MPKKATRLLRQDGPEMGRHLHRSDVDHRYIERQPRKDEGENRFMATLVRCTMGAQLAFFICFGAVSGAAIAEVMEHRINQARLHEAAAIYLQLPVKALGQIGV